MRKSERERVRDAEACWVSALSDFATSLGGGLHIWLVDPRMGDWPEAREEELREACRFQSSLRRAVHVASRCAMRKLAACYLGCDPVTIRTETESGGRPFIVGGNGLEFSLSHSGHLVLLAFAWCRIGVDVECASKLSDPIGVARRYFDESEAAYLERLGGEAQSAAFKRMWVCKEAAVKWAGCGIVGELRETVLDHAAPPYGEIFHRGQRLQVLEFKPDATSYGAAVIAKLDGPVCYFRYPPQCAE